MQKKKPLAAAIGVLSMAGLALGQTAPDTQTTRQAAAARGGTDGHPTKPVNNNTAAAVGMVMQRNGGSLLKASMAVQNDVQQAKLADVSFFAVAPPEPKTLKRHDLVTVIIREDSTITSKSTKEFRKEADFQAKLDTFVKLNLKKFAVEGLPTSDNPADVDIDGIREFKGDGELDREDSMTARITAEIVDVKPNGTLVLQARKLIKNDEEEQQFILTGNCRVDDITADNSILSTQLYDLQLQKNHKGDMRKAVERGWLPKLLDFINPF